jgi:anti-sigma regulatory factor (Ser/Thr protein kinase)
MSENSRPDGGIGPAEAAFSGDSASIPAVIQFVSEYARKRDFSDRRIQEVSWALEEAIGNVVEFSVGPEQKGFTVYCTVNNVGQLIVAISDEGRPFNMLIASDPLFESDLPGGKRPTMRKMRRYVSSIESRRAEDKNVLTLAVSRIPVGA